MIRRIASVSAVALATTLLCACGVSASTGPLPKVATTPAAASAPGDHTIDVSVQGLTRVLILHVPSLTVANRPLILVYHGAEGTAAGTEQSTDFEQVSNSTGDLVAFMQGYDDTWNEGAGHTPAEQAGINDVAYTAAAISELESLVTFKHARIAATGFSNGALMVEYLGCKLAKSLALIAPVEGELPAPVSPTCAPARSINVYEVHGTADAAIPYGGGPFNGVGGGTTVLSAPKSVARWAKLDRCASIPKVSAAGSGITLTHYSKCQRGVSVTLRTIVGGTHEWGNGIAEIVHQHIPA
jgi:polyhydroxybutyrate depolymerase